MVTMTATKAREMFYTIMNDENEPVTVTGKHGNKVIVGEDDWRAMQETVYLSSIPGMVESILEGDSEEDCLDGNELQW